MSDTVIAEGAAKLRDGKKVGKRRMCVCLRVNVCQAVPGFCVCSGGAAGWFCANPHRSQVSSSHH